MIEFIRTDHIHICVPPERLEEARLFYINIIGLTQKERPKELDGSKGHWFSFADIELHIGVAPQGPRSGRHTAMQVRDVAAVRQHLTRHGVEIAEEPHLPGRERFAFIDPFGNKMELLQIVDN